MTFNSSAKKMATLVFSTIVLTACGGGSDSSSSSESANNPTPPKPTLPISPPTTNTGINDSNVESNNHSQAALTAANIISLERQSCALGGLAVDETLNKVAVQHANYIQYVYANSTPRTFSAHHENQIDDIKSVTGRNNPFFSGINFQDRLLKVNYPNLAYGTTENIAHTIYYSSVDNVVAPEDAARSMARSLLAAPYHLRSLMIPSLSVTGTSLTTYTPYGKEASKNQGFVLVNNSAATKATANKSIAGLFSYPCGGVTNTNTALYNESPDPVAGSGRNLRTDPIGQPIYIHMPSAKKIEVSNVKLHDVHRNISITTQLLDHRQDPHKGTTYELPANEAFILPITDALKSCEMGSKKGKNCGLYANSDYEVSFDVLVDNKTLETKQFTFKTGQVNY